MATSNDNFASAETLLDGITQAVQGDTANSGTQVGENLGSGFTSLTKTQWWTYTPAVRQIVQVRVNEAVAQTAFVRALRGAAVGSTSDYATPTQLSDGPAFGFEDGRGVYSIGRTSGPGSQQVYRIQVMPDTPLMLQTGRWGFSSVGDLLYDVEFESFTPPANDDFENAEEIEILDFDVLEFDPIEITYDLEPATGQPDFDPAFFNSIGDLWYHMNFAETVPIGLGIVKDNITDNAQPVTILVWSGDDIDDLTFITSIRGSWDGEPDFALTQLQFNAGQDYYLQLINDAGASSAPAAPTGTLYLQPFVPPPNDNFADAEDLGTADSGSTGVANVQGASVEDDEPSPFSWSVWYEFTPTNGGWYEFTVGNDPPAGLYDDWSLNAYRGVALDSLTWVSGISFLEGDSKVLALRGGETYYIQLAGSAFDFGTLSWDLIASAPTNDDEDDATVLTGASGSEASDIEGATNQAGELDDNPGWIPQEATSWFEWVCPATDYYSFETSGLGSGIYVIALTVWETDTTGDPLVANLDGTDAVQGKLAFEATEDETYLIRVTLGRDFTDHPNYDTFPAPYTFDLDWDTFVPADNNLFADATLIAADPVDSLTLENFGLPAETETDFPDLPALFEDEFGAGNGQAGRARWFDFVPEHTGTYDFTLVSNGSQIIVHLFTGANLADLVPMEAIDSGTNAGTAGTYADHAQGESTPFTVALTEGETYRIVVAGFLWDSTEGTPQHWLSQGDYTLSWAMHPSENDNFEEVNSLSFGNDNIGNLNYYDTYSYGGVDYSPYGISFGSGGCRDVSNLAATAEDDEPAIEGFGPTRTLWFLLRHNGVDDYDDDHGDYRIWVEGVGATPVLDPLLAVYEWESDLASLGAPLGSDDDTNGLYPEVILTDIFSGDELMIQVDARDEGDFRINWQRIPPGSPPANDDFDDAITITEGVPFTVDPVHATVECGETPVAGFWDGPFGSVWYTWDSVVDQYVSITMDTTGIDPDLDYQLLDIFEGTTLDNLVNVTPADDFDNFSYDDIATVEFIAEAGKTYYFRFSAYADQGWDQTEAVLELGANIVAPFIAPTTTVFTPSLAGTGNANLSAPFIAPTTVVFDPSPAGDQDAPAPFIASTTEVFTPGLIGPDRARTSQEPVEVLLVGDSEARVSQEPLEVLFVGDSAGRISQEPIEVLMKSDGAARASQVPVEVLFRNVRESVSVIIID